MSRFDGPTRAAEDPVLQEVAVPEAGVPSVRREPASNGPGRYSRSASQPKVSRAPARSGPPRQKVLFIMGMTRSGSTILANVLGELEGFFAAGELRLLWKRSALEPRECGCGALVSECSLWTRVVADIVAHGAKGDINPREVVSWQRRTIRIRHTWRLLRRDTGDVPSAGRPDFSSLVAPLYRSLADLTEARIVVDSSKRPSDAALLRLIPELDVYFVHLVRDPRAVAYSWRRLKSIVEQSGPTHMAQHGPVHSTLRWAYRNLGARAVARRAGNRRVMVLRYESFVARPRAAIESIVRFVGEEGAELPFIDDRAVVLARNHVLSGNPIRFTTGAVRLADDSEWLDRQSFFDRVVSTVLAFPFLRAYDYDAWPRRCHGR